MEPAYRTETVLSPELFLHDDRAAEATSSARESAPGPMIERARVIAPPVDEREWLPRGATARRVWGGATCRGSRDVAALAHRQQAVLHRLLERDQVIVG